MICFIDCFVMIFFFWNDGNDGFFRMVDQGKTISLITTNIKDSNHRKSLTYHILYGRFEAESKSRLCKMKLFNYDYNHSRFESFTAGFSQQVVTS